MMNLLTDTIGALLDVVVTACAVAGALLLTGAGCCYVTDRYRALRLPGGRVHVFRPWFAPGQVVFHPVHGQCRVASLDRHPRLGIPWACVWPHLDAVNTDGMVPAAVWVPVRDLHATRHDAETSE